MYITYQQQSKHRRHEQLLSFCSVRTSANVLTLYSFSYRFHVLDNYFNEINFTRANNMQIYLKKIASISHITFNTIGNEIIVQHSSNDVDSKKSFSVYYERRTLQRIILFRNHFHGGWIYDVTYFYLTFFFTWPLRNTIYKDGDGYVII